MSLGEIFYIIKNLKIHRLIKFLKSWEGNIEQFIRLQKKL